ncbi:hypothetical protein RI054_44g153460 [Pseudoscourfieldia marina]
MEPNPDDEVEVRELDRVTDKLKVHDSQKLEEGVSAAIVKGVGERYDGQSKQFSTWYSYVCQRLVRTGFIDIKKDMALQNMESFTAENWSSLYSEKDLSFIHSVLLATLTSEVARTSERADSNGVLLLFSFVKLWRLPSLPNITTAFSELTSVKVTGHEDPAPSIKKIDEIFLNFFGCECGRHNETMKLAVLCKAVDGPKYKSVITTVDQETTPTFMLLQNRINAQFHREKSQHEAKLAEQNKNKDKDKARIQKKDNGYDKKQDRELRRA